MIYDYYIKYSPQQEQGEIYVVLKGKSIIILGLLIPLTVWGVNDEDGGGEIAEKSLRRDGLSLVILL
jgi:hypothetical protein